MKLHDDVKRDCIRSVISDIKNQTVNAGKEITDDVCLSAVKKALKTRRESFEQFKAAGRDDLAGKEQAEIGCLESYVPAQLSQTEIESKVKEIVEMSGIDPVKKNMGMFMKQLAPYRAVMDMKTASGVLAKLLK
jgi:hypothetical protein